MTERGRDPQPYEREPEPAPVLCPECLTPTDDHAPRCAVGRICAASHLFTSPANDPLTALIEAARAAAAAPQGSPAMTAARDLLRAALRAYE